MSNTNGSTASTKKKSVKANSNRKPYVITKQREPWTPEEHELFLEALHLYKRDWTKIGKHVPSKTIKQLRSHAQKYFNKLAKAEENLNREEARPSKRSRLDPDGLEDEIGAQAPANNDEHSEKLSHQGSSAFAKFSQFESNLLQNQLTDPLRLTHEDLRSEQRHGRYINDQDPGADVRDGGMLAWFQEHLNEDFLSMSPSAPTASDPRTTVMNKLMSFFETVRFKYGEILGELIPEQRGEFNALLHKVYSHVKKTPEPFLSSSTDSFDTLNVGKSESSPLPSPSPSPSPSSSCDGSPFPAPRQGPTPFDEIQLLLGSLPVMTMMPQSSDQFLDLFSGIPDPDVDFNIELSPASRQQCSLLEPGPPCNDLCDPILEEPDSFLDFSSSDFLL